MTSGRRDFSGLSRDIQEFLLHYPSQKETPSQHRQNEDFFASKIAMQPDNLKLHDFQRTMQGKYDELEARHGFIQWLFPIRDSGGVNYHAQRLMPEEIQVIRREHQNDVWKNVDLMLDFYGMAVKDRRTHAIGRTDNYRARYDNLLRSGHNYLRITRILKSCSEFGLESEVNVPLLLFFLVERSRGELDHRGLTQSMDQYWRHCIREDEARNFVSDIHNQVVRAGKAFTEESYLELLARRQDTGHWNSRL